MLTSEDIKLLSQLMDEKLKPINERLDTIEENTEITRVATNEVIKWLSLIHICIIKAFKSGLFLIVALTVPEVLL